MQHNKFSSVSSKTHVTNWTRPKGEAYQYSLLNNDGKFENYSRDHNKSIKEKKFHHSDKYPKLAQFISAFPSSVNFRINVFGYNSGLSQHEEDICFIHSLTARPSMRVRFHLPIITNCESNMFVEGDVVHFDEGHIYFFHNGCVHAAENNDLKQSRIHLVWDMLLTEDTFNRMFAKKILLNFAKSIEHPTLDIIGYKKIDSDYPNTPRCISYEEAKLVTLCEDQ